MVFDYVNNKVLEMARDFPAEKYDYKLRPEMRTLGAVIVHVAAGNIYTAKAGNGETAAKYFCKQLRCGQRVDVLSLSSGEFEGEAHQWVEEGYRRVFVG